MYDLDTVMPGCALHDFADLVNAACSSQEDEPDIFKIHFCPIVFPFIDGYLAGVRDMLEREIERWRFPRR